MEDVVVRSTRHILSTIFTTIAGFTPLILAGGGFWPPLAVAIAGVVVGATVLALVFVPSAYLISNGTTTDLVTDLNLISRLDEAGTVPTFVARPRLEEAIA